MHSDRLSVGIDVGGTFTDLAMYDPSTSRFSAVKVPSSPPEFWPSVIDALDRAGIGDGSSASILHGTTVHLNAFLERKGARIALVTTKGFRDVYEMRRGNRPQPYNMHFRYPDPIVARRDIFEIDERTLANGAVLKAPKAEKLASLVEQLKSGEYESIALCFLHSYRNPTNEAEVTETLRRALPDMLIAPSFEVCREWREYERTSTAVINAYASPILDRYLDDLLAALEAKAQARLFMLQSNGGLMRAEDAGDKGVLSLLSGPVGGNVAGCALSALTGLPNLICIDMGGTSFEASLIIDGESAVRTEREVGGFPILSPMIDIHTIGAGGGSIAWSDAGALRVGPRSAGARPGPACYGHGGNEPTVTDANIALGRLEDRSKFGDLVLDAELARAAIADFAKPFGFDSDEMAQGILDVINEQMANAIRTITVRRGIDPRDFALVAYGGAGPMHAADIARLLGIRKVLVPDAAGTFSAWGMLQSDLIHDRAEPVLKALKTVDWPALNARYAAIERTLGEHLHADGVSRDRIDFVRSLDLRYAGQEHAISVDLPQSLFSDPAMCAERARTNFDARYLATFGHNNPEEEIEAATLRLRAIGRTGLDADALIGAVAATGHAAENERVRAVRFDGEARDTRFIDRTTLVSGKAVSGPCVVEEATCTTIIPPDFQCMLDDLGNLILSGNGANT